jgi:peptidoglycan/xylan/chitin deacetylase (PgdA/CDA1 family)
MYERAGSMERTISLLYHDVVPPGAFAASGFRGPDADLYKLDEPQFVAHLNAIATRTSPGPRLFTFDDGGASAARTGELLAARGWRGYFFVSTAYVGAPGFASAGQLRQLAGQGHVIGSHSCSHPPKMSALSPAQLTAEWVDSRKTLEDILGRPVTCGSIPGGFYSKAVAETAAAAGYSELFTSEPVATPWQIGTVRLYGRYSVQQHSSAGLVAALAAGALRPRLQQYAYWNMKKILKRAGGEYWLRFRKSYLRLRQAPAQIED